MADFNCITRCRFQALAIGFALWTIAPMSASAQDVGFSFLIQDGWTALQNRSFADNRGMLYLGTGGKPVFSVVNGQKAPGQVATADVVAWTRSVPDPYFAPIRPLAGLIVLDFGGFVGHLAIIDTPAGPKTTVATWAPWWDVDTAVSGTWVFSDGTTVGGGTANDLVITGVIRVAAHQSFLASRSVDLVPRLPTSPLAYDPTPFATHIVGDGVVKIGSFYGEADNPFALTPVRSFTTADSGLSPFAPLWTHVVAIHVTGDIYLVVACSVDPTPPAPQYCTVSGTGEFARYTGRAWYQFVGSSIKLALQVYATR